MNSGEVRSLLNELVADISKYGYMETVTYEFVTPNKVNITTTFKPNAFKYDLDEVWYKISQCGYKIKHNYDLDFTIDWI